MTEIVKNAIINIGTWIITGIANSSYYICLFSCMVCLLLYISGLKKSGKYVSISFVIYVFIQALKGLLI